MVIVIVFIWAFYLRGEDVQIQEEGDRADLAETLLASLQATETELEAVYQGGE